MGWRRFLVQIGGPRGLLVLFGMVTVVGLGWAASDLYQAVRLRDHGVERPARIVAVYPGRMASVEVEYVVPGGRVVRAETDEFGWDPEPRVGEKVRVLVDPEHRGLVVDARIGPSFGSTWAGLGIALVGGMFMVFTAAANTGPDEVTDGG